MVASVTIVEEGNWKLVLENNRECYHCSGAHPELAVTFPLTAMHSGSAAGADHDALAAMVARCEAAGLPSAFRATPDFQTRVTRLPLAHGAVSMTMTGEPGVATRFPSLPAGGDLGDVLAYHYPSTWNHAMADHALTFSVLPLGPTSTQVTTTWLVPAHAQEGVDYDVDELTSVWRATNEQDRILVERTQRGVSSPAFRPGPLAPVEEDGVAQFLEWYRATVSRRLRERTDVPDAGRPSS